MSELTELLNERMAMFDVTRIASDPYMRGTVDTASAAMSKLNAHNAEIVAQAKHDLVKRLRYFHFYDGMGAFKKEESELAAFIEERIAQAKRGQMEADCAEMCSICRDLATDDLDEEMKAQQDGALWYHEDELCDASDLRAAWAKDHPEEGR